MADWGEGLGGLRIDPRDLGMDANLFFWHGEPRAIDFDDWGFGYWVFDLAVALDACRDDPFYLHYRDALLNGYTKYRSLPEEQAGQVDLFLAAFQVYWNLWASGGTHLYPRLHEEFDERARTAAFVVRLYTRVGSKGAAS
jgi:Ser/Thr protein kinase RdoA (MazF antagonist)